MVSPLIANVANVTFRGKSIGMVFYRGQAHVLVPSLFKALDLDSSVADPLFGEYGRSWGVVDISTLPEAPKRLREPVDCRSGHLCIPLRKLPWLLCYLATGYLGESDLSLRASLEGLDGALWQAWDEAQRSNETEHPRLNDESTVDEHPDLRVHRLSQHEILVRLFAANEARRGPGYNRRLLRSLGRCLHAVLAAAAGSAGAPVSLSLRGVAKATGMSFRSARIARDRLVAWEVLIDEAGGYRIRYSHLHDILYNAVLPAPNARLPSARGTA